MKHQVKFDISPSDSMVFVLILKGQRLHFPCMCLFMDSFSLVGDLHVLRTTIIIATLFYHDSGLRVTSMENFIVNENFIENFIIQLRISLCVMYETINY